MKTHTIHTPMLRTASVSARHGITESKKAELDNLTIQVIDAQQDVEKFEAIVTSLTDKMNNIQGLLTTADTDRSHAYNNKALIDQMVQSSLDLQNNSKIALGEMGLADLKTKTLAKNIKSVLDKLIYSAEVINKLSNIIIRKKALNPLISDDLITMIGVAGKDANNAVALTLIALKSTFAAQASNMESEAAIALEYAQSIELYKLLITNTKLGNSLRKLLHDAYDTAKTNYNVMEKAFKMVTGQLNSALADLNKARVKLKSLQAGLSAANAAALAS